MTAVGGAPPRATQLQAPTTAFRSTGAGTGCPAPTILRTGATGDSTTGCWPRCDGRPVAPRRRAEPACPSAELERRRDAVFDLVIRGGEVVTPQGVGRWDVAVKDGLIAAIGALGPLENVGGVIDAAGLVVVPGGIEPHTH